MTKFCIKCGKEIPQNRMGKKCENCQNKVYGVVRNIVVGLASAGDVVLVVLT